LTLALAASAGALAAASAADWAPGDADDQALVLWRSPLGADALKAEAARLGLPVDAPLDRLRSALDRAAGAAGALETPAIGLHHVRLGAVGAAVVDAALAAYRASGLVASAEPNHPLRIAACPLPLNAALYAQPLNAPGGTVYAQWGLTSTAWPQAVAAVCSGEILLTAPVTVAVLDSGVDAGQAGFPAGMVLAGQSFLNGVQSAGADDDNGHGTFVAGLLGAAPYGAGPQGLYGAYIDPQGAGHALSLLPVKVLDACGHGTMGDLAEGITWAVGQGAQVLNMSLSSAADSDAVRAAVNAAWASGAVMVAAAGNHPAGTDATVGYPAAYASVMSVGALDHLDVPTAYSDVGKVDLSAPGGDDTDPNCKRSGTLPNDWCQSPAFNAAPHSDSCFWEVFSLAAPCADAHLLCNAENAQLNFGCGYPSGYAAGSGTSFAAPLVSAAAALLLSQSPARGNADVVQRLEQSAVATAEGRGWSSAAGWGKLSFQQALDPAFTAAEGGRLTVWNYPNPYRPSRDGVTTFTAILPYPGPAALDVYDAAGQRVRHFDLSGPGMARADWDGRNGVGQRVANGGYRGALTQGNLRAVAKVAVLQ
jgi:subtilisin family serine protease